MVTPTRNNKTLQQKKQVEIATLNSICKTNTNV